MAHQTEITQERLERVCRMYKTNADASRALGVKGSTVKRLCERFGIQTPTERHKGERTSYAGRRSKYNAKLYHITEGRVPFEETNPEVPD